MPQTLQDKITRAINRPPRLHNRVYEKRALINGIEIYSCATSADECNRLFLQEIATKILQSNEVQPAAPRKSKRILFTDFAYSWLKEIHQKKVTPETYSKDRNQFKKHIAPYFEGKTVQEITAADCKEFNLLFRQKEIDRTWENCDGLLRQIFQHAIDNELISKHPMSALKRIKSDRENGVPLSIREERNFLAAIAGTKYELVFIVSLYTGVRPCEISTVRLESDFIIARNRKQKDVKRVVYKKIPITPMLRPYIDRIRAIMPDWPALTRSEDYLRQVFKKFCKNHDFYDLRTTFSTRTQECGVPEQVVARWMGHSAKTLIGKVYTKFSDEYLLSEGNKVKY